MPNKKRCFVTYVSNISSNSYTELVDYFMLSIKIFSEYPLIIYTEDQLSDYVVDLNTEKDIRYVLKLLAIKKALKEYDEVVWLDVDIVVNHRIDKIWNFFDKVDNIIVAPRYRFHNYHNSPVGSNDNVVLDGSWGIYDLNGVQKHFGSNVYIEKWHQSCCLLANKKCVSFLDEYIRCAIDIYSDETALNLLYKKYNFETFLPSIFICSHFFGHMILHHKLAEYTESEYINFMETHTGIFYRNETAHPYEDMQLKYNDYNDILFWHGSKNIEVVNKLLIDLLKNKYKIKYGKLL